MTDRPMLDRSPHLHGAYAPVTEEVTAFDLPVTGSLPPGLDGRYLRNGPNPMGLDDPGHWFLGAGMVHGLRLRNGRAEWYRNRWVRSREVAGALGEPWPAGPVHDGMDFAANTHVVAHAGRTLATVEAGPLPYELTAELETVGPCDFGGTLPGGYAAHTKPDRLTGDLHAVAYYWGWDHVQHVVIGPDGTVTGTTDVPVDDGPMMHDFALTERYVVLFDLPVTFNMDAAAAGSRLPYAWNRAHPARVGLLPRAGAVREARWFDVDPCWVFHTLNAHDDGDRVVVDLCRYDGPYDMTVLTEQGALTLERWTVDPVAGRVTRQELDDRPQEFPRVDERVVSRPHRYGYSVVTAELDRATVRMDGSFRDDAFAGALLKHDLSAGTVETHRFPRDAVAGEGVFVPSAPDAAEDDGYVMAFVHDPDRGAADLVVLAAQDFAAPPVAVVHLPARIPLGFHGSWIADE
ncbi:carotenoid cleavage dioxygenase [Geodermatophilus amargosae]|uniref:Dioxygenase n=1 Tax=Geodermatophilus amargosae TaxID=1296565 RepID=A0A1I7BNG2_9ACTN|nr:carotenoid oxygenase family protein [Geodermatophilus amargosae]SFT88621.1 carotenoid cleavage dioxygenase [Geodermatophilus amargosae]